METEGNASLDLISSMTAIISEATGNAESIRIDDHSQNCLSDSWTDLKYTTLNRPFAQWCVLAGLPSRRFDGLFVCCGWQSWVSQVSSKVGGLALAPVWGANPFLQIIAEVATTTSYCCAQRVLATSWFGGDSVANDRGTSTSVSPSRSDTDSRCYLVFTRCLSRWKRSVSVSLYPWWCLCLESTI